MDQLGAGYRRILRSIQERGALFSAVGLDKRSRAGFVVLKVAVSLGLCLGSYLLFSHCFFSTVEVTGSSMHPTLQSGERYILNRLTLLWRSPQRGDLVVIRDPLHGEYAVKRVVGMPADRLQLRKNIVYLNGARLMEPYLPKGVLATEDAMLERESTVGPDTYYVLGDNRDNSEDSRCYGAVPLKNVMGFINLGRQPKAFVRNTPGELAYRVGRLPSRTVSAAAAPEHVNDGGAL